MLTISAGYFSVFCEHPAPEIAETCRRFVANQEQGVTEVEVDQQRFRLTDCGWDEHTGIFTATMWRVRVNNLPAIMHPDGRTEQVGNDLGESASFAFMPARREALIQYNHHGPRHTLLPRFLAEMGVADNVTVQPVIEADAINRMQNAALVRRIEYTLVDSDDVAPLRGVGVGTEIDQMRAFGGTTIRVEISMGRERGGLRGNVKQFLSRLSAMTGGVRAVKAGVKEAEAASPRMLDLLGGRLFVNLSVAEAGRELDRAACRERLRQALRDRTVTSDEVDDDEPEQQPPAPVVAPRSHPAAAPDPD